MEDHELKKLGQVIAQKILKAALEALEDAQLDAAAGGLCREGQIELAIDHLKSLNLDLITEKAIAEANVSD